MRRRKLDYEALGKNIKKYRSLQGFTQEKLAEKAKISVNFLSKLERGASRTVSAETLQHLANALKISMEELLNGIDEEHSYTKGPYEIQLDEILASYSQTQREEICKGIITILNARIE